MWYFGGSGADEGAGNTVTPFWLFRSSWSFRSFLPSRSFRPSWSGSFFRPAGSRSRLREGARVPGAGAKSVPNAGR